MWRSRNVSCRRRLIDNMRKSVDCSGFALCWSSATVLIYVDYQAYHKKFSEKRIFPFCVVKRFTFNAICINFCWTFFSAANKLDNEYNFFRPRNAAKANCIIFISSLSPWASTRKPLQSIFLQASFCFPLFFNCAHDSFRVFCVFSHSLFFASDGKRNALPVAAWSSNKETPSSPKNRDKHGNCFHANKRRYEAHLSGCTIDGTVNIKRTLMVMNFW